jgi:parallel beta-helix repeat protein
MKSIVVTPARNSTIAQYQTSEPLFIANNEDFALLGATGAGTPPDPYVFENLEISSPSESCIFVANTDAYFVINDCRLETLDTQSAISFQNVENGRVEQCEITGSESGINFMTSQNCYATNTSIYNCWIGIRLYHASNCTVVDNMIFENNRGVLMDNADHCRILNNSIYSSWEYGVQISGYSHNNILYGNSIGWNGVSAGEEENAVDYGEDNFFDDGIGIGNSWSDFNESETYVIPGISGSVDSFAQLLEDDLSPGIVPLVDIAIDVETRGNTITWIAVDEFPASYEIHENEVEMETSFWPGGDVTYGLDHLRIGTSSITIIVYDGAGNNESDVVLVTVVSFILGGIGTELVMIASGITVVIFVVIILLIKKLS